MFYENLSAIPRFGQYFTSAHILHLCTLKIFYLQLVRSLYIHVCIVESHTQCSNGTENSAIMILLWWYNHIVSVLLLVRLTSSILRFRGAKKLDVYKLSSNTTPMLFIIKDYSKLYFKFHFLGGGLCNAFSAVLLKIPSDLNNRHRNAQMASRASVELHTLIYFRKRYASDIVVSVCLTTDTYMC